MRLLLDVLRTTEEVTSLRSSIYAEKFKRSTVKYRDGAPEKPSQAAPGIYGPTANIAY